MTIYNEKVMPNFLIIGAARSGTTSLYYYLKQHPDIFMPSSTKEPSFFSFEGINLDQYKFFSESYKKKICTDFHSYQRLFANRLNEKAIGEVSNVYLYDKYTAEKIKHYIPSVKLIVILRNPIDRAYSHYIANLMNKREKVKNFADAIALEKQRIEDNWEWGWHYIQVSCYSSQLERYYNYFRRSQIKIVMFEDFISDPMRIVQEILEFLEIDSDYILDISNIYAKSGLYKNIFLDWIINNSNPVKYFISRVISEKYFFKLKNKILSRPEINSNIKSYLLDFFYDDIKKVERLIQKDLSIWLK